MWIYVYYPWWLVLLHCAFLLAWWLTRTPTLIMTGVLLFSLPIALYFEIDLLVAVGITVASIGVLLLTAIGCGQRSSRLFLGKYTAEEEHEREEATARVRKHFGMP
ncbi:MULTISPECIES: hypothetical protein [Mesorhizobium]|uniref:hypothetical protein n=1 Tax=Mesorhizobium australicum TaxID=536018 RepID=UPI00333847DE